MSRKSKPRCAVLLNQKPIEATGVEALLSHQFGDNQSGAAHQWLDRLAGLPARSVSAACDLFWLSVLTALACGRVGGGGVDPVHLAQGEVKEALRLASVR